MNGGAGGSAGRDPGPADGHRPPVMPEILSGGKPMLRQRSLGMFVAGAVVAAALTTAGTAIAGASTGTHPRAAGACGHMWAIVRGNGNQARRGCPDITSKQISTGVYEVNFSHNVRHCAYSATVGASGGSVPARAAEISVQSFSSSVDAVLVAVYSAPGTPVDEGFDVLVDC
jgi:hypothetical protein